MRNAIVLSVLLLSACTTAPQVSGAADAGQAHQQSVTTPPAAPAQPVAPQKSAPVDAPQPAPGVQGDTLPKKPKHNVEAD